MKKRIITLVAAAAAVALLAICYVAVSNMGNGGNAETTAPPPTSYTVAEIDRKTVYALGYTYEGKSYDLMLNEQMTGWNLKSNEALPISNTVMAYMIKQFEFIIFSTFLIEASSAT